MQLHKVMKRTDEGIEDTGRIFRSKWSALQRVKTMNRDDLYRKLVEVNKLSGIKRGKGVQRFHQLLDEVVEQTYFLEVFHTDD